MKRWLHLASDRVSLAVGWWLLFYAAAVCIEVLSRKFFGISFQGIDEVGGYTLAVFSALGYSIALLTRGHTRVDFVLVKLPPRMQCILNVVAMLLMAGMAIAFADGGMRVLEESMEFQARSTSPLQTPLAAPQSIWLAGLVLFALTSLILLMEAVMLALKSPEDVNRRFGPPSLTEEIRSESGLQVEPAIVQGARS